MSANDGAGLVLQVVVGSTRPGRVGLPVAEWIRDRAVADGRFEVELVDLADVNLPLFDEPHHPRLRRYVHQHTKEWSATVDRADGFVFVIPEYNHAMNAAIKNAIDYLHQEWAHKPVGIVSYGGVAAGARAAQSLKPVLAALRMTALVEAVPIPFVAQFIEGEGDARKVVPNDEMEAGTTAMLGALARWIPVGRSLRAG